MYRMPNLESWCKPSNLYQALATAYRNKELDLESLPPKRLKCERTHQNQRNRKLDHRYLFDVLSART
jgi:hypothetical protein